MTNGDSNNWASFAAILFLWAATGYGLLRGFKSGRLWSRSGIISRSGDASGYWTLLVVYTVPYAFVSLAIIIAAVRVALGMSY